jgi:hypothetical protein
MKIKIGDVTFYFGKDIQSSTAKNSDLSTNSFFSGPEWSREPKSSYETFDLVLERKRHTHIKIDKKYILLKTRKEDLHDFWKRHTTWRDHKWMHSKGHENEYAFEHFQRMLDSFNSGHESVFTLDELVQSDRNLSTGLSELSDAIERLNSGTVRASEISVMGNAVGLGRALKKLIKEGVIKELR